MESSNNSGGQDANNRPPVDQGTGGRGGTCDTYSGRGSRRKGNNRDNRNDEGSKKSQFTGRESAMNGLLEHIM